MGTRSLAAVPFICWSLVAGAQISGQFYLEKSSYVQGEPVFLFFQIVNNGSNAEKIESDDPYCSGYQISISSDPKGASCSSLVPLECLSGQALLQPGQKRTERVLLNYAHEIDVPGEYTLDAGRYLRHAPEGRNLFGQDIPRNTLEVHAALRFRVDQDATRDLKSLQVWVDELGSTDPVKRGEAARVLASMAPRSLEDTLLGLGASSDLYVRQFAPLAFYRLDTPRSMEALAGLMKDTPAGEYERTKSAEYLSRSGDQRWFPLLQQAAKDNPELGNYLDAAARLGGEKMLPALLQLATDGRNRDLWGQQSNATSALGSTGSRAAVPTLLNLLKSPRPLVASAAVHSLQQLTHRTAVSNQKAEPPQEQYRKWSQWWKEEGTTAPIYKATECGDFIPLP